jgi:protein-S-isoprenylcysteine O-methyltransferase Ste14
MVKSAYSIFAAVTYTIFLATFLYLIGFVGDLPWLPNTVNRGAMRPLIPGLLGNVALIGLFGLQHSVMARASFKQVWTKVVPKPLERSVYVLAASLVLIVLFAGGSPLAGDIWRVETSFGNGLLWALFACGWLIVLLSTFLLNHFELFGLQQVYHHIRGKAAIAPTMRLPLSYKIVRHPLYSGFFIAFWATPHMTVGHLLLAVGMSAYMLGAIQLEERDLVGTFGDEYETYRHDVGMLAPRLRRKSG